MSDHLCSIQDDRIAELQQQVNEQQQKLMQMQEDAQLVEEQYKQQYVAVHSAWLTIAYDRLTDPCVFLFS